MNEENIIADIGIEDGLSGEMNFEEMLAEFLSSEELNGDLTIDAEIYVDIQSDNIDGDLHDSEELQGKLTTDYKAVITKEEIKSVLDEYFEENPIIGDYPDLENKPKINGIELDGDRPLDELGIQPEGNYALKEELPDAINEELSQAKASGLFDGKDGEGGATFTPSVSKNGDLSWSNDKGLLNPETVNIKGDDGFSPTVSAEAINGGYRITLADAKKTQTVDVLHGVDGEDGNPGKDGISILSVEQTVTSEDDEGINTFVVTLSNDETTEFIVRNGSKGSKGDVPVNGIDYHTPEEVEALKAEIVDSVLFTDANVIIGDKKAYILTDYIPNSNTRIVAKTYFNATTTTSVLFGARTSTSSKRFDFGNNSSSKYNFGWNETSTASTLAELSDAFELDVNKNTVYINGEEAVTREYAEFETEYPLAIFGCNTKGTVGSLVPSGSKIYWLKIYENDELLYDFIPRKHLVDGYGLYDNVRKKFYGNISGSGAFKTE